MKSVPVNIENFGGGFVGCLKITKDKSSKRRGQTPDAGLIIAITVASRREGQNPRLSITAAPRREGQNPRLNITAAPRREGRNSHLCITAAPRRETRVSVITVLVIGSIAAHIMRKLTPIMERL